MKLLALSVPGYNNISAPGSIPTGGLDTKGNDIIHLGIQYLLFTAIILAVFFLMWAGIQWTMSGGDKAKIDAARKKITYAVIGLIIAFLAFFIVNVLGGVLGIGNLT